jgi:hypothetical protein
MNFLIAVISESYTNVNEGREKYIYKDKAEMNLECQSLLALILPEKDLKCVSFTTDKTAWEEDVDPNADIKNSIKDFIQEQSQGVIDHVSQKMSSNATAIIQLKELVEKV